MKLAFCLLIAVTLMIYIGVNQYTDQDGKRRRVYKNKFFGVVGATLALVISAIAYIEYSEAFYAWVEKLAAKSVTVPSNAVGAELFYYCAVPTVFVGGTAFVFYMIARVASIIKRR